MGNGRVESSGSSPKDFNPTVLLLDPSTSRRKVLCELVEQMQARSIVAADDYEATELASEGCIDCAVLAVDDKAIDDVKLEAAVHALRRADVPVAAYADGASTWSIARRCKVLLWGVSPLLDTRTHSFQSKLSTTLRRMLGRSRRGLDAPGSPGRTMADLGIVGRCKAMLRVFRLVERIAELGELPVLILGETGTGKEVIARAIHSLDSRRRRSPMVAVNCGALPASLAEAELFGHARGAFSGANQSRSGLVRAADGGVLLLDEIGELDLALQTRLLRFLQEGTVRPVGGDQEEKVDVRVLAATHQDLGAMVKAGSFREDLYYRLSVVPLCVPPLRERRPDIAPLVDTFLAKHSALRRDGPAAVTPDFVQALEHISLPGNVRQLENILRRSLAEADHDDPLGLADLPEEVWEELAGGRRSPPYFACADEENLNLARRVESCERSTVQAALRKTNGSRTEAARVLGISCRGVYNKIQKYGLAEEATESTGDTPSDTFQEINH